MNDVEMMSIALKESEAREKLAVRLVQEKRKDAERLSSKLRECIESLRSLADELEKVL